MRKLWVVLTAVIAILTFLIGVGTLLVADSPYDSNVDVDRNPVTPERPANMNGTAAADHAVAYEQTRLFNDLVASRGYTVDTHDTVITRCNATSVSETEVAQFRVELRCTGGIDDTNRLYEPGEFSYNVTYQVTDAETNQIGRGAYPFD